MKLIALAYGALSYLLFFVTFLYAIGFVEDRVVPRTIDNGMTAPMVMALAIDAVLLGVFALQHSIMARQGFKRWWTKFVPSAVERSTYVLFATLALILVIWQWRSLPTAVWTVTGPMATVLLALSLIGWGMVLLSTFLINHFELFGLRQVWANLGGGKIPSPEFVTPFFYKLVRHPLYLGFIIAFWSAPVMSQGRLFFAFMTTAYIVIAIQFEERDMIALFGERYVAYRKQVSMLLPLPKGCGRETAPS